ncbi:MAG: polysaccharide deacetylase family protein [Lewinellaceae bacterium]|nr:polysaccharide deacetylase family protein [Lewinellaceae bacterium]
MQTIVLLTFLQAFFFPVISDPLILSEGETLPQVILKLDDLKYEDGLVDPGWQQVIAYLRSESVVGTIGIIGSSLEEGTPAYFQWIKDRHADGFEIWNHGYCHCQWEVDSIRQREFQGPSAAEQYASLAKTQQLAQEKLGITLRTFGAPYNSTDAQTAMALEDLPDIHIWLYKESLAPTHKYLLPRIPEVNIEYPVHVPDFEQFRAGFEKYKIAKVLVIQGHPRSWVDDPTRFATFQRIVAFLKARQVHFTTPYAYYLAQQD